MVWYGRRVRTGVRGITYERRALCVAVACVGVGRLGLHEALVDVGRGELVGALPVVGVVLELLDVPPNHNDNVCVIGPLEHAQIEISEM